MDGFTLLLTVLVLVFSIYFLFKGRRPKNFPPGPTGVPIFHNVFQLGPNGFRTARKYAEKYGPIIGFQVGSYRIVYLSDPEDIRDALNRPEFAGRYGFNNLLDENAGVYNAGILLSTGKTWQEQRRFTLKTLRDFGMSKRSIEGIIQEEVAGFIAMLKKSEDKPISTQTTFNLAVFNIIWSIVAGERHNLDDPRLNELISLLSDFLKTNFAGVRKFFFLFRWFVEFRNYFPFLFSKESVQFREKLFDFFRKTIKEHKETIQYGSPRDFIDTYLEETEKMKGDPSSSFKTDDDDFNLLCSLMDIFIAGGETTSTTLTWAFFLLALNPEAQEKMYKEIVSVGALDRPVVLADEPQMPYAEAVMTEVFRISSLVPQAIPHAATQDVEFKGYVIPKNTLVAPNLWSVHYSESIWGDPLVFRPERFLSTSESGLTFNRSKYVMAFSTGKRVCIGESLGRNEFFLFLTNSVKTWKIKMPQDEPKHTYELQPGAVSNPEPHRIILTAR